MHREQTNTQTKMSKNNSVTLFLMGEKGLSVLKALIPYKKQIVQVVGARDPNVQNDYFVDIHDLCEKEQIKWVDRSCKPIIDSAYSIAIAWRWLIPIETHNTLIILHDSLLPKYRGFAPLVNMLINHEPSIGVTALFANEEFDRGDIICQKSDSVVYPIRIDEAIEKVSKLYVEIVLDIIKSLSNGQPICARKQKESEATYSLWRDEKDYNIDWNNDAEYIQQFVYSLGYPYNGAATLIEGQKYRLFDCKVVEDVIIENRCSGKVLFVRDGYPIVVCGKGLLQVTKLMTDDGQDALPLKKYRTRFE